MFGLKISCSHGTLYRSEEGLLKNSETKGFDSKRFESGKGRLGESLRREVTLEQDADRKRTALIEGLPETISGDRSFTNDYNDLLSKKLRGFASGRASEPEFSLCLSPVRHQIATELVRHVVNS